MPHALSRTPSMPTRHRTVSRALVGSLALLGALLMAALAPEPDAVPRRWQLDVEPGGLRISIQDAQEKGTRPYYYFTYTVTNNSGQDRLLAPAFELSTDTGDLLRSGRDVPLEVSTRIKDSLQNPLVDDQIRIIGNLLQGKENAKQGVVIWPVGDVAPSIVTIYASGFSGETAKEAVHGAKEPKILRKTLMIRYRVPGDLTKQGGTALEEIERRWIMR